MKERYSLDKAQDEAKEIQKKVIKQGLTYPQAEEMVEVGEAREAFDKQDSLWHYRDAEGNLDARKIMLDVDSEFTFDDIFRSYPSAAEKVELAYCLLTSPDPRHEYYFNSPKDCFNFLNDEQRSLLVQKFLAEDQISKLIPYLKHFQDLDEKVAMAVLDSAYQAWMPGSEAAEETEEAMKELVEHVRSFLPPVQQVIISELMKRHREDVVIKYARYFSGLDHKLFFRLIGAAHKQAEEQRTRERDSGTLRKAYTLATILFGNLQYFSPFDQDDALRFIKLHATGSLLDQLDKFQITDEQQIVDRIIQTDKNGFQISSLIRYLDEFKTIDKRALALRLIKEDHIREVLNGLGRFSSADYKDIALAIIHAGQVTQLESHMDKFHERQSSRHAYDNQYAIVKLEAVFDSEVALAFIDADRIEAVVKHMSQFKELDRTVALRFIAIGYAHAVLEYMGHFKSLDKEVAIKIIHAHDEGGSEGRGKGLLIDQLIERLDKFIGLDDQIAQELIRRNASPEIARNLFSFHDLGKTTAALLIERGEIGHILNAMDRDQFQGLDASIGAMLKYVIQGKTLKQALIEHPELALTADEDPWTKYIWEFIDDAKISLAIRKSREVQKYVCRSVAYDEHRDRYPEALSARLTHGLSPEEYYLFCHTAVKQEESPLSTDSKVREKSLIDWLESKYGGIEDENLRTLLSVGRRQFSDAAMLAYMNRVDLSRHEALHFMPAIIRVQEQSGLAPAQFANNILLQVAKDNAGYGEVETFNPEATGSLTAHHHFAAIMQALEDTSPAEVFEQLKKYPNVLELQKLVAELEGKNPFSSWKSLKKFYDVKQLLGRTDILKQLNTGSVPPRLRAFIEKLAFHPNISTDKVMQFWRDTLAFLDIDDIHTPHAINEVKKPRNLVSLPYIGLTAEDLRDALVNGELDDLQVIPPMERFYYFGVPTQEQAIEKPEHLHHALHQALGERKRGIKGVATNVPKLFEAAKKWCEEKKITWEGIWHAEHGQKVIASLTPDVRQSLVDLVYHKTIGIRGTQETFQTYRARIGLKSDPDMAVAGNDSASCMPFGSGKNNVYMFNPLYAQMVVERLSDEGKWRTASQSVLSIDHQTSTPTPELIKAYLEEGKHLKDLVKEGDLERLPVLTCDNIEPSKNEEGGRVKQLHDIHQAFFETYLREHAEQLQVSRTKVPIGQGYTPENLGFKSVPNTYIPQAPAGYSDNVHEECFLIETGLAEIEAKRVAMSPLTTRDAINVAILEGKAYSDNTDLLANLHRMQNNLIGMEIANRHFDRPKLSFMYRDEKGLPRGYILAFEGQLQKTPFVYIDDLASDRQHKTAGGRLIKQFFETYATEYGKEGRSYLPIFTNARDKTSFPILRRHAERLAKEKGLMARLVEIGTHYRGKDLMHDVVVVIGKDEEALQVQEQAMKNAMTNLGGARYADEFEVQDDNY
ncbi:hypothetical protein EXS71_03195 [Candidatus Uhrbacteria bacterium]|nr:hypothetical protein [Candidatus Uhrbacteria bacterium]